MTPARLTPGGPALTGEAWLKMWEIGVAAPMVIGLRLAGMAPPGRAPTAGQRRENLRMGQEKLDAWSDAILAVNRRLFEAHLAFSVLLWRQAWTAAISPTAAAATAGNLAPRLVTDSLTPVHRRVVANQRRLSGRR